MTSDAMSISLNLPPEQQDCSVVWNTLDPQAVPSSNISSTSTILLQPNTNNIHTSTQPQYYRTQWGDQQILYTSNQSIHHTIATSSIPTEIQSSHHVENLEGDYSTFLSSNSPVQQAYAYMPEGYIAATSDDTTLTRVPFDYDQMSQNNVYPYTTITYNEFDDSYAECTSDEHETPGAAPVIDNVTTRCYSQFLVPPPTQTHMTSSVPANLVLFTYVPGRLTVLGDSRKLPVTLAEIRRRLNLPECLNRSNLSALLRKAKNRDGGSRLTAQLNEFQIQLSQGRRKAVANSSFTSLLEQESMNLVKDFATMSDQFFPFTSVAYETLMRLKNSEELVAKQTAIETALPAIMNLASILRRDKSPIVNMPLQQSLLMHPESQREFTVYSLLTHGFGTPAHLVALVTLLTTLKTTHRMLLNPVDFCRSINRPVPAWLRTEMGLESDDIDTTMDDSPAEESFEF